MCSVSFLYIFELNLVSFVDRHHKCFNRVSNFEYILFVFGYLYGN